jgi:hypothetical protein
VFDPILISQRNIDDRRPAMTWRDEHRECHCRIDEPAADQELELDDRDHKVIADVETFGWHLVLIYDGPASRGWIFSVGMWHTLGSPELVLFGLESGHAGNVLNTLGGAIRSGRSIGPDVVMDDILAEGRLITFRRAHDSWYRPMFGYATWFAQRPPLPVAQVVWADPDGHFPWDDGVDPACRDNQPSLWIPADEHPMSGWSGVIRDDWVFPTGPDTKAFTTVRVFDGKLVVFVAHDTDGTWQFIDSEPWVQADIKLVHLGHVIDQDPSLRELAGLPAGWEATRTEAGGTWSRNAIEPLTPTESPKSRRRRWPWQR